MSNLQSLDHQSDMHPTEQLRPALRCFLLFFFGFFSKVNQVIYSSYPINSPSFRWNRYFAGMRAAGMRVAGMRAAGMRVAGMRAAGMRATGCQQ